VASQVATRQGIDIVVGGNVSRSGDEISVAIRGINPADHAVLFELWESAESDDEVLTAIASLARELRAELGDADVDSGSDESERFWVANLKAASEYLRAQEFQASRNYEEAVRHFSRAIEFDPRLVVAYSGRALAEYQLGMSELAARDWEFVMSRLDDLAERDRLRTLGNYYVAVAQDWQKALEVYERLVERYPADSAGQNNLAVAAFYNLDFERALSAGRKVAERFPAQSLYKANLALYAMYSGEFDEAHSLAQQTIERDPQNGLAWVAAALAETKVGNLSIASDTYRKMMEVGQFTRSHAYEGLADVAMYEQDYAAAVEILAEGIASDLDQFANDTAAIKYMTLAEASLALGQRQEALDAIERGLRIGSSDNSEVRAALLLTELSEFEKAQAIANELSNDSSRIRQAYAATIRASIASSQSDPVRAVEFSKTAIETADLWLVRYILGHVYLDAGFPVEAYNEFQICKDRVGETLAIFLDERPTLRITRELEAAIDRTNELLKQPNN
jgi:tetratricopeptide (TPR) repeat protein